MWPFKKKLKQNGLYVVEYGERTGCFLVYIKEENIFNSHAFLSMPTPLEAIYLEESDVDEHLKSGGLKLVEKLPTPVYDVCKANFQHAKKGEECQSQT